MKESFANVEWYLCCIGVKKKHVVLFWIWEQIQDTNTNTNTDTNGSMDDLTLLLAATVADPSFKLMKLLVGNPNVKLDIKAPTCRLSFHICFQHIGYTIYDAETIHCFVL